MPSEDTPPPTDILSISDDALDSLLSIARGGDSDAKNVLKKALGTDTYKLERKKQRQQTQPYYKEEYAKELIPILDAIDRDKTSKKLLARDYPRYRLNTIYTRISQSLSYIIDNLDPDGKYKIIRETFRLEKKSDRIIFEYIGEMKFNEKLILHEYKEESSFEEVREVVEKFIEEGLAGQKVSLPDKDDPDSLPFTLIPEQIVILETLCKECEKFGLFHRILSDSIFLGKVVKEVEGGK